MVRKIFSMKGIQEQNTDKCKLVVVLDKVYDVSTFLSEHPGGEEVLLEYVGKVASDAFEEVAHSPDAREMMAQYCVGELCEEDRQCTRSTPEKFCSHDLSLNNTWRDWILPASLNFLFLVLFYFYGRQIT